MNVESFVDKTYSLLELERETEKEETRLLLENVPPKELQRRGVCLLNLRLGSRSTGLYGRTILVFEPFWQDKELPSHNLSPGDIVALSFSHDQTDTIATGIVSHVRHRSVSVAFDETTDLFSLDSDSEKYKIIKLANDITYKRLRRALDDLKNYRSGPCGHLINILFEGSSLKPPLNVTNDLNYFNENLDTSQREAVQFALNQADIAVIHGPPGTGKTTTVIEIIRQAIKFKMKVLACAPSNIAVDNLVERLGERGCRIVRLGHPARVLGNIQKYSLDAILSYSDETKLVEDVRRDMDKTMAKMRKVKDKGSRQSLREDLKHLRKELRERETAATREILKRADVVLATLTSANRDGPMKHLEAGHFDLVVIDECSQAMEAACWIALLNGSRCILAGDHQQLPPTIMSDKAAKDGLAVTLMERVLGCYGDNVMRMLTTQYRMNEAIMKWSSDQLYHGKLVAHESVATHLLSDLPEVDEVDDTSIPLLLIDTAGCDLLELELSEHVSKGNEGEADLVAIHVDSLISSGVKQEQIAVIAPYNLQVELLRIRLSQKYSKLEIKSVDSFQGREKEAVVISLVRSNLKGEVGFLAEDRRINVAITRARRHLAVICDTQTVSHHKFLKSLVDYMSENGEVRSAHQYQQEHSVGQVFLRLLSHTISSSTVNQRGAKPKVTNKKSKEKQKPSIPSQTKENDTRREEPVPVDTDHLIELRQLVETFAGDDHQGEHVFPASLTSRERRLVHEVSEELGLVHMSQGEGEERYIVIRKKETKPEETISSRHHHLHTEGKTEVVKPTGGSTEDCTTSQETKKTKENVEFPPTPTGGSTEDCTVSQETKKSKENVEFPPTPADGSTEDCTTSQETKKSKENVEFPPTPTGGSTEDCTISQETKKSKENVEFPPTPTGGSTEDCTTSQETKKSKENVEFPPTPADGSTEDCTISKETKKSKKKKKISKENADKSVDNEMSDSVQEKKSLQNGISKKLDHVGTGKSVDLPGGHVICDHCKKPIPKSNHELHSLRCSRTVSAPSENYPSSTKSKLKDSKQNNKTKPGAKAKTKGVKSLEKVDDGDFDALIAAATKIDKVCNFLKCKTSTACIGQQCDFCGLRFCLSHHIPEVHGCGDKAKTAARQTLVREGVLYRGSGVPNKKPDAQKRAHLQNKLDKVLNEKSGQRQRKKKEEQK